MDAAVRRGGSTGDLDAYLSGPMPASALPIVLVDDAVDDHRDRVVTPRSDSSMSPPGGYEGDRDLARAKKRALAKGLERGASFKAARAVASDVKCWLIENSVEMCEAFDDFDRNGDGTLSIDELVTMVEPMTHGKLTLKQLRLAFESLDTDHSGYLDCHEFRTVFHVAEGNDRSIPSLQHAVDIGDTGLVRSMLRKRPALAKGKYYKGNWTALMGAACNGQADTAEALLLARADVDERDSAGWSALHHAASHNHAEVARVLCHHGACAVLRNTQGRTPIEVARSWGAFAAVDAMRPYAGGASEASFDRRGHPTFARGLKTILDSPDDIQKAPPGSFLAMSFEEVMAKSKAALEKNRERWNHKNGTDDKMWDKVLDGAAGATMPPLRLEAVDGHDSPARSS